MGCCVQEGGYLYMYFIDNLIFLTVSTFFSLPDLL